MTDGLSLVLSSWSHGRRRPIEPYMFHLRQEFQSIRAYEKASENPFEREELELCYLWQRLQQKVRISCFYRPPRVSLCPSTHFDKCRMNVG